MNIRPKIAPIAEIGGLAARPSVIASRRERSGAAAGGRDLPASTSM
jgi:hypothetical protein